MTGRICVHDGLPLQISVNRSNQYASAMAKHGPTGSAYVTFRRTDDALRCIKQLDGMIWNGKPIKACFGTTKYCNAFLKGLACNNPDCLYLHELGGLGGGCAWRGGVRAGRQPWCLCEKCTRRINHAVSPWVREDMLQG